MTTLEIGCCGAYCRTCRAFRDGTCRGCKLGYEEGKRDIKRAKCRMKVCCFAERGLQTCADCQNYETCEIIRTFQDKSGRKYKKYKEAMDFIRAHGYEEFLTAIANPDHEEHESFMEWAGAFNPEEFDAKAATRDMRRGLPNWREMA